MPRSREASTFGRNGRFRSCASAKFTELGRIRPRKYKTKYGRLGFDVKVVRQIISIRKKEPAEVEEQETLLDLYRRALGM